MSTLNKPQKQPRLLHGASYGAWQHVVWRTVVAGWGTELTLWSAFLPMRLHGNMRIQMVQSAICLFAPIPTTFVHSLNFFISSTRALVLLRTWDWDKGVDLKSRFVSHVLKHGTPFNSQENAKRDIFIDIAGRRLGSQNCEKVRIGLTWLGRCAAWGDWP